MCVGIRRAASRISSSSLMSFPLGLCGSFPQLAKDKNGLEASQFMEKNVGRVESSSDIYNLYIEIYIIGISHQAA